jgi:hypothetical protein
MRQLILKILSTGKMEHRFKTALRMKKMAYKNVWIVNPLGENSFDFLYFTNTNILVQDPLLNSHRNTISNLFQISQLTIYCTAVLSYLYHLKER